jgi:AAA15 family ATPase/GTPase
MIHRLEIENFYSIRETQVIDLRIGAKVPDDEGRFGQIKDGSGERVPKTVALFGANASGKSNVLKALSLLQWFLVESWKLPTGADLPFPNFADSECSAKPTRIRVHFDWLEDFTHKSPLNELQPPRARYVYEVRFQGEPGKPGKIVLSEELRQQPQKGKSRRIFLRNEMGQIQSDSRFPLKGLSHILSKLRPEVSLFATIAQFAEHQPTLAFLDWARTIATNILAEKMELDDQTVMLYYLNNSKMLKELNSVIEKVDLGIQSISILPSSAGPFAVFTHQGLGSNLPLFMESQGTKQFIKVFPSVRDALDSGGVAVLDELDSAIHPMLLPEILRWFRDPGENPHNAQIWFSAQSVSLLEELKKEEIFFTEKDSQGRTRIYGLGDIESVRRSDNFYQKYLGGVYGAVPRIG